MNNGPTGRFPPPERLGGRHLRRVEDQEFLAAAGEIAQRFENFLEADPRLGALPQVGVLRDEIQTFVIAAAGATGIIGAASAAICATVASGLEDKLCSTPE